MNNMVKLLPKVELHAHLNGSLSLKTVKRLAELRIKQSNGEFKGLTEDELKMFVMEKPKPMEEVFKIFPIIQALCQTPEAVALATTDVMREFEEDGTVCLELRSTPKANSAMTKQQYIDAITSSIHEYSGNLVTRLLLSIDRQQSVEEAEGTVELAANDETGLIVGVELSGNPSLDGRKFIPVLERARSKCKGLKVAVHLAEVEDNLEEVEAFLNFGPDRIGHGTFLHKCPETEKTVREKRIPIEICLSSNVFSRTTSSVDESHIRHWMAVGHPVSICTDDKGMMGDCSLSGEYELAAKTFNLSIEKLKEISLSSLEQSFLDKSDDLYANLYKKIADFKC